MELKSWNGYTLYSINGHYPEECTDTDCLNAPLVILVDRDPAVSRGWFEIRSYEEAFEPDSISLLINNEQEEIQNELGQFIRDNGATVLNTAFKNAYAFLKHGIKRENIKMTLVGLGDVGGTCLTALKLLGQEIDEIQIFDPNEVQCKRYALELNQVIHHTKPKISICSPEDLFHCDYFLFTASRGVPAVGSQVSDVRMVQFDLNRQMLKSYAKQARDCGYLGMFCQISDPVDHLARAVYLDSNTSEDGCFDGCGLLPEQIQGFGLGVMYARAAFIANEKNICFDQGRAYGPHGADLVIANDPVVYDPVVSETLTKETTTMNLRIRDLGFKPYIAPALSSAAISILAMIRKEEHHSCIPFGKAYFGCRNRLTDLGIYAIREELHESLQIKLQETLQKLEEFRYD